MRIWCNSIRFVRIMNITKCIIGADGSHPFTTHLRNFWTYFHHSTWVYAMVFRRHDRGAVCGARRGSRLIIAFTARALANFTSWLLLDILVSAVNTHPSTQPPAERAFRLFGDGFLIVCRRANDGALMASLIKKRGACTFALSGGDTRP